MSTDTLSPGAMLSGPLYAEVKRRITKSLMEGDWPQGTPIPSEAQFAQRYAVSMGTVRKAIGELVAEKILVRQPGRGTFAANHNRDYMLDAYFHIVDREGNKEFPESTLLSFRRMKADAQVARHLRLRTEDRVFDFENLLRLQGRPAIFDHIRVPQAVFPDFDENAFRDRSMTIFGFYQARYGVTVTRLEEQLRAENANARVAQLLELDRGAALLKIERVGYTYDGTPVEYRERFVDTRHHAYLNVLGMKKP
jgi:GntR family transcriptional regulator